MAIGTLSNRARAKDSETRGSFGAGEIQQASDRGGGGRLSLSGKRVARIDVLLQPNGFGQPAELATILIVHDRHLDGIGPYVDDGDGRHVQKRN